MTKKKAGGAGLREDAVSALKGPRVVLCMILGNEAALIERCLTAAMPVVDAVAVCVNGTDDTAEIVRRVTGAARMPCAINQHEWKNFGHNRTAAVDEARKWILSRKWLPEETYLLFLDADHVLVNNGFERAHLTWSHFQIEQVDPWLRYYNTRLARLDREWRSIGPTHEYWEPVPDVAPRQLTTLWIDDRNDGGSKGNKTDRDIQLLTEGLATDPENVRYQFYLAQCYEGSGKPAEAAEWYAKRMKGGGFEEERWYAAYRYAEMLLRLGRDGEGEAALLDAWNQRPGRAEPIVALAKRYREKGKNHLAMMLAERAAQIPYPASDRLFVHPTVHQSGALDEISIVAYYCGKPERGMAACESILSHRAHTDALYEKVARNQTFYLQNIPVLSRGRFPIPLGLDAKYGMHYAGTNPTIVRTDDPTEAAYDVHVRLVNYEQTNGRYYKAADDVFRTRGAVLKWSPTAGVLTDPQEVTVSMPEGWHEVSINGLEDVRWVDHGGRLWFTATCCQVPGAGGWPRVVLGMMSKDRLRVERVLKLDYGKQGSTDREKNWVPWSKDGELLLIYSYDPFVVVKVNTETGSCEEVQRWTPHFRGSRWKGSAAPVRRPDGRWLMLVHETAYMLGKDWQWEYSVYSHRFVELDDGADGKPWIRRCSRPFTFERNGTAGAHIEYAAGLALAPAPAGAWIVTYGVADREAAWASIGDSVVEEMLTVPPA